MTLTHVNFELTPDGAGNQRMGIADGGPPPADELGAVTNLTVTSFNTSSITYGWSYTVVDAEAFTVEGREGNGSWVSGTLNINERAYTFTDLKAGTLYGMRIRPFSATEVGEWRLIEQETEGITIPPPTEPPPSGGDTDLDQLFFYTNFEEVPVGQLVEDHTVLNGCPNSIVTTDYHWPGVGTRSMRSIAKAGKDVYNDWGFIHESSWPTGMGQHAEVWFRVAFYFPNGWINKSNPALKMLRHGKINNGQNRGYNDIYMKGDPSRTMRATIEYPADADLSDPRWCQSNPNDSPPTGWHCTSSPLIPTGQWVMIESYSYQHHTATRNGGKGVIRCWVNGEMVIDGTGFGTMRNDGSEIRRVICNSIWNWYVGSHPSTCPLTQTNYYDQVAVAVHVPGGRDDRQYLDTDAHGNRFIGMKVQ